MTFSRIHSLSLPSDALDSFYEDSYRITELLLKCPDNAAMAENVRNDLLYLADRGNWEAIISSKTSGKYMLSCLTSLVDIDSTGLYVAIVTLLYDFLVKNPSSQPIFSTGELTDNVLAPLRRRILTGNDLVSGHTGRLLAVLILANETLTNSVYGCLFEWVDISLQLYPEREQRVCLSLQILCHVLRVPDMRSSVLLRKFAMDKICMTLLFSKSVQVQYHALFVIWLFSFDAESAEYLQKRYAVITQLLDVCKAAIKSKVIRLCIGTWRNYLEKCPRTSIPVMIGGKVLQYLESAKLSKIGDEEVEADIQVLKDALITAFQSLNSFDEYASEIKSGKLSWSPPHKSDLFWKDNASRLQANDFEILRILTHMLHPNNDPEILAIAANDVGMYVSHHPIGRKHLEELGTKSRIMSLLYHTDPEVRFQALSVMQKYMKNMWNSS